MGAKGTCTIENPVILSLSEVELKDLRTKASLSSALRAAYGGCALYARLRAGVTREVAKIFDF